MASAGDNLVVIHVSNNAETITNRHSCSSIRFKAKPCHFLFVRHCPFLNRLLRILDQI
jgi:hypothetical protein